MRTRPASWGSYCWLYAARSAAASPPLPPNHTPHCTDRVRVRGSVRLRSDTIPSIFPTVLPPYCISLSKVPSDFLYNSCENISPEAQPHDSRGEPARAHSSIREAVISIIRSCCRPPCPPHFKTPQLAPVKDAQKLPGTRMLPGKFMAVEQASLSNQRSEHQLPRDSSVLIWGLLLIWMKRH